MTVGCGTSRHVADYPAESIKRSDEAEVISTWVNLTLKKTPQQLVLVLDHSTFPGSDYAPTPDMFQGTSINGKQLIVDPSIISCFLKTNQACGSLASDYSFDVPHRLLSTNEVETLFAATDGWKEFNTRYSGSHGYFTFSFIGFNTARTEALLYVVERAGSEESCGRYILFWKRDGKWFYVAEKGTWIS